MDAGMRGAGLEAHGCRISTVASLSMTERQPAADIAELIEEVTETVKEKFGVRLEPEVIFLGDF